MLRELPLLVPPQLFRQQNYRDVLKREMDGGKIPLSLGKACPVKCEFCYELDHPTGKRLIRQRPHKKTGSLC